MSKSCFNMLSYGTPSPHPDQLVAVMLDHLLRLFRSARSQSMHPIHIYAELLRYPIVVEIQVTLKYAVCGIAATIDVHTFGLWNKCFAVCSNITVQSLEQLLKEPVWKELEDKFGMALLVVDRLMLMAGDCTLLEPEKASYPLHAAGITHPDGAVKQIALIRDIRLMWKNW
ncbi:hypothetical protein BDD12DRAFT_843127 [Trichophaea hybrida]|nr:hypothetical protein BDD12DRAFT_843127 [Trichophaea hybrida]